ncbi:MAG: acetyl-CoA carboxylase biotin carboxylase subunit [Anaerolineales bacterium]|nr:MAG: acetyl-CoA carboxylase biotin carboxylase subunit [Anaerolineales bacterium]
MLFKKVLIANRGEIALRIVRACRELGLESVAIYSDVDRKALHVRYADEAYYLGPAPSQQSYLRNDKIIEIARKSSAQAIHPGYGFLSEQADFAQACVDEGIIFIGPGPAAISKMGDKGIARAIMTATGVPVVPGTEGEKQLNDNELIETARKIGFPVLIKATGGGGGKGIREVHSKADMPSAIEIARMEAKSAFGDDRVYLEKVIDNARHIEIQILADQHGNIIHLGERECSIQRRHQKLLEEAPSPFIGADEKFRQKMGEVALRAARAVDYVNAGTVEFLVDKKKNFYFLEMNTRLQVEHPVTELVTGIDIVKEQIRIARGRQLGFRQDNITMKGWAIECRINAEDPYNKFMPSPGYISEHTVPTGPGVRVDTGVYNGFAITPYYDPLISKLIVWGENRAQAILRMRRALEEYKVIGVVTNIPFHQNLTGQTRFMTGNFDTRFVEERFSMRKAEETKETYPEIAAITATLVAHQQTLRSTHIIRRGKRDTSNWKWVSRWERMHR